jgi:hypothetical protein
MQGAGDWEFCARDNPAPSCADDFLELRAVKKSHERLDSPIVGMFKLPFIQTIQG